jgi:hypothetical protein
MLPNIAPNDSIQPATNFASANLRSHHRELFAAGALLPLERPWP